MHPEGVRKVGLTTFLLLLLFFLGGGFQGSTF